MKTADETEDNLYSIEEGYLPILISYNKMKTIINLKTVQFVPNADASIISVSAFNLQFKTYAVLYPRTGHLLSRKLGRKIAAIEQINGIYKMRASVISDSEFCINTTNENEMEKSSIAQKVTVDCYIFEESSNPNHTIACLKTIKRNKSRKLK